MRGGGEVEGDPADFEPLEEGGEGGQGVVIAGLRKEFGSKVAVAGLDLRLLPGDITCLLGHNGAGEMYMLGRACAPLDDCFFFWGEGNISRTVW